MNILRESALIAGHDLRRFVRTGRGVLLVGVYLGAVLLVAQGLSQSLEHTGNLVQATGTQGLSGAIRSWAVGALGVEDGALQRGILDTSVVALLYALLAYGYHPMLAVLLGYDAVSAETQHGTVRFVLLRTHRVSFVLGKWFARWSVHTGLFLVAGLALLIRLSGVEDDPVGLALTMGRIFLCAAAYGAAFMALVVATSTWIPVPSVALFASLGWLVGLGALWAMGGSESWGWLAAFSPYAHWESLVRAGAGAVLEAWLIFGAFALAGFGVMGLWTRLRDV